MTIVLIAWAVGHFFVISQIADALIILGGIMLGAIAYQAGSHLVSFALKCLDGTTEEDLDESAHHLAEAIALIGVQAVMSLLLLKAPRVLNEPKVLLKNPIVKPFNFKTIGKPPTSSKVFFENYEADITLIEHHLAGVNGEMAGGLTKQWGDISILYAKNATIKEIAVAVFHEKVHRFLTPRLQVFKSLRQTAAILKRNSYLQSTILRYLEEALAETFAQVKVNGWRNFFVGVRFPTDKGYVSLIVMGKEAQGIFLGPINVGGMSFNVYYSFTDK